MKWLEPSPQSTSSAHGLSGAGSVNEPRAKDFEAPSDAVSSAGAVTVGATFLTVTEVVYSVAPSSLSMIRPRTVYVPLSANVHCAEAAAPEPAYVAPAREPFEQLYA